MILINYFYDFNKKLFLIIIFKKKSVGYCKKWRLILILYSDSLLFYFFHKIKICKNENLFR